MTLRHMKIFVAVYQQKSITLASNSLHLAQPSVSLAIKELEEYYHIRLFDRLSRRIYPTENGHRFYEYALHIVSLFSEMENKIPAWDANAPLHIGSSITLGTCLLPSLVKVYQEQHPEIKIYVTIKNTGTIEQAVVDNQLDFALVEGTVTHPEIISEVFSADTLCMVAAPGHPLAANRTVTLADAASCPLLLREPGSAGREIVESLFIRRHPDRARLGKRQHPRPHPRRPKRSRHRNFTGASRPGCTEIRRSCLPSASARHPDPQPIPDPAPQQIPFVLRRGISEFMPDVEILSG